MIGFVGLGNMGAHMARNLIKKGHQLVVYDINKESVADLVKFGINYITLTNLNKLDLIKFLLFY